MTHRIYSTQNIFQSNKRKQITRQTFIKYRRFKGGFNGGS